MKFPTYVSPLLNMANRFARATTPAKVGQLSELFYRSGATTVEEWKTWYFERYPYAVMNARHGIMDMIKRMQTALDAITEDMVHEWVCDLMFQKTFDGFQIQDKALAYLSEEAGKPWTKATPREESLGIDGHIGPFPVSVKPESYDPQAYPDAITVPIVTYRFENGQLKFDTSAFYTPKE